ncbi:MAG: hypothetical protein EZS28_030696, partial [Streblomastix strix]
MQSTLSSDEYCQSATRSARSDREHGQFVRSKFEESDFENRQLVEDCQQRQSQIKQFGQFYQLIRSQSSELDSENRQLVRYRQNQEQQCRIIKQTQFLRSSSNKVGKQNRGRNQQHFTSPNSNGSKSGMPVITSYGQDQVRQVISSQIENRVIGKCINNLAQQVAHQYISPVLLRLDQAGRHEGRWLRPAGISSASNEPMDVQQQCNVQFTQQLNSGDFKHLDINQTRNATQIEFKVRFDSPTTAVTIDRTCRKLFIESFKRMGSNWSSRSSKIRNLRQLEKFQKSQMALRAQKHSESYLELDSVGKIAVVNQQGTGAKSGQGSQRRRREVVQPNSSGPKWKKWQMEESSGLPFAKRASINGAFQNGGRISAERSSLQRRLGNKDRLNECLSSRTGQLESEVVPRIQVQGKKLRLYSNVFRAHTCPSDFPQDNETHNGVHSINFTDQKRVVLRRSGVSSSIKRGFNQANTLNLGNISKVWMASINGEVCINSDSAIRVSRMVLQHKHKPYMHDSDQESRAAVTNIEMEKNNREEKDSKNKVVGLIDRKVEFFEDTDKERGIVYEKNEQIEELSSECQKLEQLHVDKQKCSDRFGVVEQSDCNQSSSSSEKHITRRGTNYRCKHGIMGRHLRNNKHRKRDQTVRTLESSVETGLVQLKGDSSNISC